MNPEWVAPEALKAVAKHLLFVSEVRQKIRCPVCHGKPAVIRWRNRRVKKKYYGCGCGHQWDPPSRSMRHQLDVRYGVLMLVHDMAKTGELPEVPEKENP